MSYQSNGIVSSGLPSLYDEVAATDTTDKSLSILSAVTGKEVAKTSVPHKNSMPPRTAFLFMLFISSMLGFTYWQYTNHEINTGPAITSKSNLAAKTPHAPAVAAALAATGTPKSQASKDAALIETVSVKPAVASIDNSPKLDTQTTAKPHVAVPVSLPVASPAIATPTASPIIEEKPELQKVAEKTAPIKKVKNNMPQAQAENTAQTRQLNKQAAAPSSTKVAEPTQSSQRTLAVAQADPDEKLLEGILRLIKRDHSKESAHVRPSK